MTTNSGPENDTPGMGGRAQRPHATLDLTAEEVSSGATPASDDGAAHTSPGTSPESLRLEGPAEETPPGSHDNGGQSFATHMAAGAFGAFLALVIAYFVFFPSRSTSLSTEDAQTLRASLAALEGRANDAVTKAEQLGANGQTNGIKQDLAALAERVARIEARQAAPALSQDAVQQSLDPLTARIAELDARLAAVAKAQSDVKTNSKATALALALYNLRRAANEGKPFAVELQSVADMSPVPLDLGPLQARREQGVRSVEQLQAEFDAAANKAIDAEDKPADDSFASELWSKAKSFVRVRRKGDVPGETTRAILARVEHRLDAGDLSAAVTEAAQLSGEAAAAVAPWLVELKAKLAADDALALVEARLLAALGGENQAKRGG